jgi:hypothetical protein
MGQMAFPTFSRKKARQARTKRIRSFMRRILGGLLRDPERRTRAQLRHDSRIVVDGLPESMREPPHTVKSLPKTAELAAAQPRLDASATAQRNAKAA